MAKDFKVEFSADESELVIQALEDRKVFLNDNGASLLKKKLGEAATPLFKGAKKIEEIIERVREAFNKANQ
jgi:hypothetical protein